MSFYYAVWTGLGRGLNGGVPPGNWTGRPGRRPLDCTKALVETANSARRTRKKLMNCIILICIFCLALWTSLELLICYTFNEQAVIGDRLTDVLCIYTDPGFDLFSQTVNKQVTQRLQRDWLYRCCWRRRPAGIYLQSPCISIAYMANGFFFRFGYSRRIICLSNIV